MVDVSHAERVVTCPQPYLVAYNIKNATVAPKQKTKTSVPRYWRVEERLPNNAVPLAGHRIHAHAFISARIDKDDHQLLCTYQRNVSAAGDLNVTDPQNYYLYVKSKLNQECWPDGDQFRSEPRGISCTDSAASCVVKCGAD
jgi:hypothetical protein